MDDDQVRTDDQRVHGTELVRNPGIHVDPFLDEHLTACCLLPNPVNAGLEPREPLCRQLEFEAVSLALLSLILDYDLYAAQALPSDSSLRHTFGCIRAGLVRIR